MFGVWCAIRTGKDDDVTDACVTRQLLAGDGSRATIPERVTAPFEEYRWYSKGMGFDKVLVDCLAVTGELSDMERCEMGKTLAEYCVSKSTYPKVAMIGKPPAIDGFGAQLASNRDLTVRVFSESQAARKWLSAFGSKPTGS